MSCSQQKGRWPVRLEEEGGGDTLKTETALSFFSPAKKGRPSSRLGAVFSVAPINRPPADPPSMHSLRGVRAGECGGKSLASSRPVSIGHALADQVLRAGDKVLPRVGLVVRTAGVVPGVVEEGWRSRRKNCGSACHTRRGPFRRHRECGQWPL